MSREELRYIRAESFTSGYVMRRYDDGQRSEGDARSIFGLSLIFAGSKWKRRHEEGEGHQVFLMTMTDVKARWQVLSTLSFDSGGGPPCTWCQGIIPKWMINFVAPRKPVSGLTA